MSQESVIVLPEGHNWEEVPSGAAQCVDFQCRVCGASFINDMESGSVVYEEGDESHDLPDLTPTTLPEPSEPAAPTEEKDPLIAVGAQLTRVMGKNGDILMPVRVTKINESTIECGAWTFDIATGLEIDEDLGWGPETGSGSYIKEILDALNDEVNSTNDG